MQEILSIITNGIYRMLITLDTNIKYLIVLVVFDFITGIFRACIKRKLNSSIGLKGIFKKMCYFVMIAISVIIGNILEVGYLIKDWVIYSLIFNEVLSILENCSQLGIKLPRKLTQSLAIFNSELEKDKDIKKTKDFSLWNK